MGTQVLNATTVGNGELFRLGNLGHVCCNFFHCNDWWNYALYVAVALLVEERLKEERDKEGN